MGAGVINGVSALLVPLPLRYAAVVPAQNASGCPMPRPTVRMSLLAGTERHKARMTVSHRQTRNQSGPAQDSCKACHSCGTRPAGAEQWAQGLVSQPGVCTSEEKRERRTGMNIMKYTETKS